MRIDHQQHARITRERPSHVGNRGQGRAECAPQRPEEAAFGRLERAAVECDHERAACARIHGGGLKEHRLADTGNAVDDGDERHVALNEPEQRCPLPLPPDERAGALIERRLHRALAHRILRRVYAERLWRSVHRRRQRGSGRPQTLLRQISGITPIWPYGASDYATRRRTPCRHSTRVASRNSPVRSPPRSAPRSTRRSSLWATNSAYTARWPTPSRSGPANSRRAPTRTSATCGSGSTRRPQAAS